MTDKTVVSSETLEIAAPAELVWEVLTDFGRYGEWNQFCPSIEATLEIGSPVKMQVDLGMGLQEQVEYITCIEAPRKITWSMENKPGDPVHADRSQVVEALDEVNHPELVKSPPEDPGTYYLQVGAFRSEVGAERRLSEVVAILPEDVPARVLTSETEDALLHKVWVGPVASLEQEEQIEARIVENNLGTPLRVLVEH